MRGPLLPFLLFATTCLSTSADFRGWMRKVREEPPLFEIVEGETRSNSPVWGSFVDRYSTQGYGFLELYSNESYSDRDQAFNAGIFEGYATADRAIMHYDNLWKQYCAHQVDSCVKLFQFIGATLNYMQQQATELAVKDPYWHQDLHYILGMPAFNAVSYNSRRLSSKVTQRAVSVDLCGPKEDGTSPKATSLDKLSYWSFSRTSKMRSRLPTSLHDTMGRLLR
uniref:Phospholipase B-like n=1 Tax=Rhipicephalus microplus TaxID=6941 RepID=A0A6M2D8Z4_RHIMP